jgi:hypothetical protein
MDTVAVTVSFTLVTVTVVMSVGSERVRVEVVAA